MIIALIFPFLIWEKQISVGNLLSEMSWQLMMLSQQMMLYTPIRQFWSENCDSKNMFLMANTIAKIV